MNKNFILPIGLFLTFLLGGFFISCQKDDAATGVDNFTLLSTRGIETACGLGATGCYELVFPVSIQFSDSSTVEVTDYATLKQAIRDWFVANGGRPGPHNRPTLVFPIQVINAAGEIIDVATRQDMKDLIALCAPVLGGGGHHGGGGPDSLGGHGGGPGNGGGHGDGPCFTLVFPITVSFSDSTQVTVNSPEELGHAAHDWNKNNPGQHARPQFVFPITVTLKDGTQVVVNSREELKAIKDACRG